MCHVLSPRGKHLTFPCEAKNRDLRMRMVKDRVWEGKAEPESTQKGERKGIFSSQHSYISNQRPKRALREVGRENTRDQTSQGIFESCVST